MKCACGDEGCKSRIEWDTGSHSLRATWSHGEKKADTEVMIYYDANALVELIKEAREALISLIEEGRR